MAGVLSESQQGPGGLCVFVCVSEERETPDIVCHSLVNSVRNNNNRKRQDSKEKMLEVSN